MGRNSESTVSAVESDISGKVYVSVCFLSYAIWGKEDDYKSSYTYLYIYIYINSRN